MQTNRYVTIYSRLIIKGPGHNVHRDFLRIGLGLQYQRGIAVVSKYPLGSLLREADFLQVIYETSRSSTIVTNSETFVHDDCEVIEYVGNIGYASVLPGELLDANFLDTRKVDMLEQLLGSGCRSLSVDFNFCL